GAVLPVRKDDRAKRTRENWWLFERDRPALRDKLSALRRFIATPVVSKHRVFVWVDARCLIANLVDAIARDDDTTFGVLHSRFHEAWSLRLCTWLGVGNDPRYTPTTTFETFPFPEGLTPNIPAKDYAADPRAKRIAKAAKKLDDLRRA
ncbi:MAG: type IIL restriction-modification enzyme MmeI, partial [Methylocystis sp.]